jgi:acyl-CoA synthetase
VHDLAAFFPPGSAPGAGSVHERYVADRLAEVRRHAAGRPDGIAFVAGDDRLTWRGFDARSTWFAQQLIDAGLPRGARVGVLLPDGVAVHIVYLAAMKAGVVVVAIGPRAARLEVRHLLTAGGATALVSLSHHRDEPVAALVEGLGIEVHLVLEGPFQESAVDIWPRELGLGDIHLLNSTSGTTGMPKCVVHNQNRWFYYHRLAVECGDLRADDVFLTLIPAPYGFAQWTANFTPAILGAPTVVMPRFGAEEALRLIERERVTVVCCVSTQFIMMLNSPLLEQVDLRSLRCMFTGGEAVPFERAAEFERRTGAKVLQFFGSNETGALSRTSVTDTTEQRLRTAGKVIDAMAPT